MKNIAAALGRDDSDAAVVSRAITLARAERAMITLIHVVDSASSQVLDKEVYDEHTRDDEQYLLDIAEEIRKSGIVVEFMLAYGNPANELASFTRSHNIDLLVMGSHGHRLIGDLLWGETVDPVRHRIKIPVMVVS